MFKQEFETAKRKLEREFEKEMEPVYNSVRTMYKGELQFTYETKKVHEFIEYKASYYDQPNYWSGRISTINKLLPIANEVEVQSLNKLLPVYTKYNQIWEELKSQSIEKKTAKIDPLAQYKVRVKDDEEKLTVVSVSDYFNCVVGIGDYGKKTHNAKAKEFIMSDDSKRYMFYVNCGSCKFGSYVYMLPEDYVVNCEKCLKKSK